MNWDPYYEIWTEWGGFNMRGLWDKMEKVYKNSHSPRDISIYNTWLRNLGFQAPL